MTASPVSGSLPYASACIDRVLGIFYTICFEL